MKHQSHRLALLALCAAALMPATVQAQSYAANSLQPAPLYPYELQPGQSYAMEVAPGTYVVHRRGIARGHAPAPRRFDQPHGLYAPAPVVEMRQPPGTRRVGKSILTDTRRIVREVPVVIKHRRVEDDRPHMIVRRQHVEAAPSVARKPTTERRSHATISNEKRVVHAEAEITILGPDRINIRLYRKGGHGGQVFDKK